MGDQPIGLDELALATRNHGMPLEALRYDLTPAGMHYQLTHYDIPLVDPATWRLEIAGERTLTLSLEAVRTRPRVSAPVTLECAGNGRLLMEPRAISQPWGLEAVGTAEWTGTPLAPLLDEAGIPPGAIEVVATGLDRGIDAGIEQDYQRSLALDEARRPEVLLAYEMNGQPLPAPHGFPLRLVVPGWYGMASVKWLRRIETTAEPFDGYHNAVSYRWRTTEDDEPGTPLDRIRVRSLLVPPGIPNFLPRTRHLAPGPVTLEGRAWSGAHAIARVDVSTDGGASWAPASLDPPAGANAWWRWTFDWDAAPGEHVLCSRATDASGAVQPMEPEWNVGGYANNAVHRVPVSVHD